MAQSRVQQEQGLICFQGGPIYSVKRTLAGVALALDDGSIAAARPRMVLLQADHANGAKIYVGGSGVTSAKGLSLEAGEYFPFILPVSGLASWYFAGTSGDSIRVLALGEGEAV